MQFDESRLEDVTEALAALDRERRVGRACRLLTWTREGRPPVLDALLELMRGNREMRKHAARAIGAVLQFTQVEPSQRVPPPWGAAAIGAADVEKRIGVRVALWKFGVGGGTRVRVFGRTGEASGGPVLVLPPADYESDREDD